jgi:hypothetical protein
MFQTSAAFFSIFQKREQYTSTITSMIIMRTEKAGICQIWRKDIISKEFIVALQNIS